MRGWWQRAAFDKRLRVFLSLVIVITSVAVLLASTLSSISTITKKSRDLMTMQVRENARAISTKLWGYYDTTVAIMLDTRVQSFLEPAASETMGRYVAQLNQARDALSSFYNMSGNINFMVVVRTWPSDYVMKGTSSLLFDEYYQQDLAKSVETGVGALRMTMSSVYNSGDKTTLTIYSPVYSAHRINKELGALCLNMDEELLFSAEQRGTSGIPFDAMLYSANGGVICANAPDGAVDFTYQNKLQGDSGSFQGDGRLYVYHRVENSAFYVVGATPLVSLYRDSINTMALLTVLIAVMAAVSLLVAGYLVKRMYQSLSQLKGGMKAVAGGELSVRLNVDEQSEDFQTIYKGFNSMTRHIQSLMERVKAEERQAEQIRYSALQAQIHPHFLYNTLDCIRWMAAEDGNPELVRLVKAMAQFYRICLSRGKDVITVEQELQFTQSYMTIQNIRYGGNVHYEQSVPGDFSHIPIPKITIQPLVENCVQHGFVNKETPFTVRVTGRCTQDYAALVVEDDGAGMSSSDIDKLNRSLNDSGEEIGYGVRNVHRRIRLLFGEGYGLFYALSERGGVSVEIRLPKEDESV